MKTHVNTSGIRRPTVLLAAAGAGVLLAVSACGSSSSVAAGGGPSDGTPTSSMPSMSMSGGSGTGTGTMIEIKDFAFSPMDLTVAVGTTVTWKFDDSAAHTVKANDGSFTSPALKDGQTFSYTFTKAGSYPYICSIHQYMTGMVTVK